MMDLLLAPENQPFSVALGVMLGIAAIEGVATLFGAGLSGMLDSLLGDVDFDLDVDLDADAELDVSANASAIPGSGLMTHTLGWLRVGKVPLLVLLVIFLTAFGLAGLATQRAAQAFLGVFLPGAFASIPALFVAFPSVRLFGGWIARIIPKDETSAVSQKTFVGRIATITLGTAAEGQPTQARLQDEHGRTHYVMVEPDIPDDRFDQGEQVLLVRAEGARFYVIAPPTDALLND